ncbi:MAG: response regulator, partial [Elusimicrobia bacterium]|nr:response regulator [Elusimicrobiota bacterium]MBD3412277.1 response regulator [Elusimicrobiota bacterium]
LKNGIFQVALVDIKMPGTSGIEVLKQIKSTKPDMEVLIITGHASMEQAIQAVRNQASDFILKPFDNQELFDTVEKAFHNYELRADNKRLIKELREERDRLIKLNEKLREVDQMKSSFVSTVSHELRTPLTVINSTVNNLLDGVLGQIPEALIKWLEKIKNNTIRLNALIEDILDMARLESGKVDMHREKINLTSLVTKVVSNLQAISKEKNITITTQIPENLPSIDAHPGRIEQVITNLLTNALKFTPENGEIFVSVTRKGGYVQVAVRDTGIGISSENLLSIFDRFRQVENKQDPRAKGIGLGLAIAKEIIAQHNGRIWAESNPGKGSTFVFMLPLSLFASGDNARIMVIDDDEEILELFKVALERLGSIVETCNNGETAIQTIRTSQVTYDIVYSDLDLPGKNGVDIIREIKQIDPEIQTAIVTAFPDSKLLTEAMQYGPLMIVSKPIDGSKIYEVTRKLLAQKRLVVENNTHES